MPCRKTRYCISMMFYGSPTPFPRRLSLSAMDTPLGSLLSTICMPKTARSLVFLIFEEECVQSMLDTFEETDDLALSRAVECFRLRLKHARKSLSPQLIDVLKTHFPLRMVGTSNPSGAAFVVTKVAIESSMPPTTAANG